MFGKSIASSWPVWVAALNTTGVSSRSVVGLASLRVLCRTGSEISATPCLCAAGVKASGLSVMFPQATASAVSAAFARSTTPSASAS